MKILVCGGRNFGNLFPDKKDIIALKQYNFIKQTLDKLSESWPKTEPDEYGNWLPNVTIISGMAPGADSVAVDWSIINYTKLEEFPANWKKYGKSAGPIRNQLMIEKGKPDLVVAFPGGKGTQDMINRANKAGIKVIEIEYLEKENR